MKQTIDNIKKGEKITVADDGSLIVPDIPIIPYIEGDGIGSDIMAATHLVINEAVQKSYNNKRKIAWTEVYAGEKANKKLGDWLPDQTLQAFRDYKVGIKGPLTTPPAAP